MAHFHEAPAGDRLSQGVVMVSKASFTVGLQGYQKTPSVELDVRSDNTKVTVTRQTVAGNSRQWLISGPSDQTARIKAVDPGPPVAIQDEFTIEFGSAVDLVVRPITRDVYGKAGKNHFNLVDVPAIQVIRKDTYKPGNPGHAPEFRPVPATKARLGIFMAKKDGVRRAAILLLPEVGKPDRVLIGISEGARQNEDIFSERSWENPLSPALIKWMADSHVIKGYWDWRWGAQVLASKKPMALLLPVRAKPERGTKNRELGPFADAAFTVNALKAMATATGDAFTVEHEEVFSFSSGIDDLRRLLQSASDEDIDLDVVYNIDPTGGWSAAGLLRGAKLRQFLSGATTSNHPRPNFEFMPRTWWAHEPNYPGRFQGYLHSFCMAKYVLGLALQLP